MEVSQTNFALFYKRGPTWPQLCVLPCFFVAPHVSLLLVFPCSSCFVLVHVFLFNVFHYSFWFVTPFVSLLLLLHYFFCFIAPFALVLHCFIVLPPMFHYCVVFQYSLAHPITFLPLVALLILSDSLPCPYWYFPPSLFCSVLEIWNCLGGSLEPSKLTKSLFCSSFVFLNFFLFCLLWFISIFLFYFFLFFFIVLFGSNWFIIIILLFCKEFWKEH